MSMVLEPPRALRRQPAYRQLKEFVIAATGLAFYASRDDDLCLRLSARMNALQMEQCGDYLETLRRDALGPLELDKLTEQLTIGETYFFRHREAFDALRDTVLPELIRRNRAQRRLRIWSAGCSTGAEAYSLAILLKRDLAHLVGGWELTILGTDINREYLAAARHGRFERWAMRSMPDDILRNCFLADDASWRIKPEYRAITAFRYHNLARHPLPSLLNDLYAFDLILCRNVMIYFSGEIVRRIIDQSFNCLVAGGWLLVGHAENNQDWYRAYQTIDAAGAVFYRKPEAAPAAPAAPRRAVAPPGRTAASAAPPLRRFLPAAARRAAPGRDPAARKQQSAAAIAEIRKLADQGRLESAAGRCRKLLERDENNPAAHFYQGLLWEQLDRAADAEAELRRAIALDGRYFVAYFYLGVVLEKQQRSAEAAASFRALCVALESLPPAETIPDADDLTVADLLELTQAHWDEARLP